MKLSLVLIIYRSDSSIALEASKFCEEVLKAKSIKSKRIESDFRKDEIEKFLRNLESIPLQAFLIVSSALFCIGIWGLLNSRNAVRVLMSIELMLNAVNINLMAFSSYIDNNLIQGQVFTIFVITVAAAEAAVGLAILLSLYRNRVTVDMESFNLLKW